jgi:hypothetical protein
MKGLIRETNQNMQGNRLNKDKKKLENIYRGRSEELDMELSEEAFLKMEGVGLSTTPTRVEAWKEYEAGKE